MVIEKKAISEVEYSSGSAAREYIDKSLYSFAAF